MIQTKGLRIILIEDNDIQRELWARIIKRVTDVYKTYWVDIYKDPKEACDSIKEKNKIAAVICDLSLGDSSMSGVDVFRFIRYGLGKNVPFMLTSANNTELEKVSERRIHKLSKPVDNDVAVKLVCDMIEENLGDIRWAKLEDSICDIGESLKKHVDSEESRVLYVIEKFILKYLKKLIGIK
ncbi:MAG: response regulator [Candidatus Njordarchaeales archaeon]